MKKRFSDEYQRKVDKIHREDLAAGRSEDFSFGRIDVIDEVNTEYAWSYEKWADFCFKTGCNLKDVLEGITFQRAINEAVKAAVRGL